MTASTRCSRVFGPAIGPVLGHVPDEDDRDPLALGEVHQPDGRLADLPDAARRSVELVDRRGLDAVDDDRGRAHPATGLDDRSDVVLGQDLDVAARLAVEQAQPTRPAAGPARPTPRPSRRGPEPASPAATWSSRVDLPIPGSPPTRINDPGTRPPPRTRSSSPMPVARRGTSASPMSARATGRGAPSVGDRGAATAHGAARRGRPSRRGCSRSRTTGTGPPSAGSRRRTTGRRTDSWTSSPRALPIRWRGQTTSAGSRDSAAWMSRPASGSLSTTIVVPGS